jgi:hypothetical protein
LNKKLKSKKIYNFLRLKLKKKLKGEQREQESLNLEQLNNKLCLAEKIMATIQLLILLNFIQVWFQRPKIFKCVMKCILTTANTSIMLLYQTKRNFSKRWFLFNRWKNNNKKKLTAIFWNQSTLITEKHKKMHQQMSKIYSMRITVNSTEMYWCQTLINLPNKCLLKKI